MVFTHTQRRIRFTTARINYCAMLPPMNTDVAVAMLSSCIFILFRRRLKEIVEGSM